VNDSLAGNDLRLAGWVQHKRDHGGLLFLDLRDKSGVVQLVCERGGGAYELLAAAAIESVISVQGTLQPRVPEHVNDTLGSGSVELWVNAAELLSAAEPLPLSPGSSTQASDELRLRYRYLDLRRPRAQRNLALRAKLIASLRRRMDALGFTEVQTPILTASSPEGARDYLVPSRRHPGRFFALPQAPQVYKQLLMCSGLDRYYQIAPCFRDEDARADRSPGEFYQLDVELAFVTEQDVFAAIEPVIEGAFRELSTCSVTAAPFPRITYRDALLRYGSDKPDLRNPLVLCEVSASFAQCSLPALAGAEQNGEVVRAIRAPGAAERARSFFDGLVARMRELGAPGLAYLARSAGGDKGVLAKLTLEERASLAAATALEPGDALLVLRGRERDVQRWGAELRRMLGEALGLIEQGAFRFCWVDDFPMYERDPETGALGFCHNPFSMPQGGLEALRTQDPLAVLAHQYDIVCNGIELSSGAIRNHRIDVMYEAFRIAGYAQEEVDVRFGGLLNAFRYGAPPHGGVAPGIDRMVMLIAEEPNIREVIAFPMAQSGTDPLLGAPAEVREEQLRERGIRLRE
jgi:aspartyl-tRNA synthetase